MHLSKFIKGQIQYDETFAAATANHFLCYVVKLPITELTKKKVLSRLREMGKNKKANREKEIERVEHVQGTGIPNLFLMNKELRILGNGTN